MAARGPQSSRSITRLRRLGTVGGPLSGIGVAGWILFALVATLCALLVATVYAPATVLDALLQHNTGGKVRLAGASGTLWSGEGDIVLADVVASRLEESDGLQSRNGPAALRGVTLPGRVRWSIDPTPLLIGRVQAQVRHDSMKEPVAINGGFSQWSVGAGSMQLPSVNLGNVGSLWNTLQPSGSLSVNWQPLQIQQGALVGRITAELRDIASALTPVRPLGAVRLEVDASGQAAQLRLSPLSGPLRLSGSGQWTLQGGLRFSADAQVDEAERLRLQSLLAIIGRREGDRTVIKIGA